MIYQDWIERSCL